MSYYYVFPYKALRHTRPQVAGYDYREASDVARPAWLGRPASPITEPIFALPVRCSVGPYSKRAYFAG